MTLRGLRRHGRWVLWAPKPTSKAADGQISERTLLTYLKRVLKQLGLPGHLHTFRHSFISHALISGVPEATVRSWVGHVDADILRTYTHINDQASQAAMARLSSAVVMAENSTNTAGRCP
jgi:integrase